MIKIKNHRSVARLTEAVAAIGLLALTGCAGSVSQEDKTAGVEHVCSSCHGMDGKSVSPTFPRLAGQQKTYLVNQLVAFRDHSRADPHAHTYMWGMAAKLDDATIEGLATYYSSQTPAVGVATGSPEEAAGKKLFAEGNPDRGVPACGGCHGDQAQGGDMFPRLAGQHRSYLEQQLSNFSNNSRANEIMHENSKNLTEAEVQVLAAYLASL